MTGGPVTVTRERLYEEVWQTPVHILAPKYGLSDVGLKKVCKKLLIPTPPRGYWMRIKSGAMIGRPSLLPLKHGQPNSYRIQPRRAHEQKDAVLETIEQDLPSEMTSALPIRVAKTLHNPHPLVAKTENVLMKAKPDEYGVLRPWRQEYLNLRVSPALLKRGLRILDALIKGIEARGFSIKTTTPYKLPDTRLVIFGETVGFSLVERIRRKNHIPTQKEIEEQKRYTWSTPRKWDYEPTGELELRFGPYLTTAFRKTWSDGAKKSLEEMLDDFVLGAIKIAKERQRERLIREEKQTKWEEEQRILEEERRRQEQERQRLLDLESQVEQWAKAKRLRAYVRAVQRVVSNRRDIESFRDQLEEWASWAKQHAENLDPINKLSVVKKSDSSETDPRLEDHEAK
jgi:hypothetical protein